MSHNNDEQARRAQAAQNNQWASNSSQPQNFAYYQTGTYSDSNEPIIHTTGTVPMNTLNSPSSHSRPVLPYDPTRQSSAAHDPSGQENLLRTTLVRATYGQGELSREPLGVGFGAQHPNYYAQAAPYPGPGPSGSQTAQTHPHGLMSDSADPQSALSDRDAERLRAKVKREEKISKGECPNDKNPLAPGKSKCERCAETDKRSSAARRQRVIDRGICYVCRETPGVAEGKKCQNCIDDAAAKYQSRK